MSISPLMSQTEMIVSLLLVAFIPEMNTSYISHGNMKT